MTTKALKAEATGSDVEFEFNGITYTVPASINDQSLDVLEAIEDGRITAAVRAIIGDAQYAVFKSTKPTIGDLNVFFEALQKAAGWGN